MLISTFLEEVALLWVNAVSQRVIKSNSYESLMSHSCDQQMLSLTRPSKQTSLSAPGGPFWAIAGSFNGVDVFKSWSSPSPPILCKRRSLSALSAWTERVLLNGLSLREGSFRRRCGASVAGPSVFVYWAKAGSPSLLISASGIVLFYGSCRCDWMFRMESIALNMAQSFLRFCSAKTQI